MALATWRPDEVGEERSIELLEEALPHLRAMSASDPTRYRGLLATSLTELGRMDDGTDQKRARSLFEEALAAHRAAFEADPTSVNGRRGLAKALDDLGFFLENGTDPERGFVLLEEALEHYRLLPGSSADARLADNVVVALERRTQ